jgi:CHRD domain-containing protein
MKRLAIPVAILALALAGCGSDNSTPTTPSNLVIFSTNLTPQAEVPPITTAESVARGTATITIHKDTNQIDFQCSVTGFPAGSALNNAHIHGPNAPAGVPAGVFVGTGISAANFPTLNNGAATFQITQTATADQINQILANPQNFYFNLHSVANPGGVMRGQLK